MTAAPEPAPPALYAAAASRSALVWVSWDGRPARVLWHLWHDGASLVVVGGGEQAAPGLADSRDVRLTVRSTGTGARLVTVGGRVEHLSPGSPEWEAAAPLLAAARLNADGGPDAAVARWRTDSHVLRLVPDGPALEAPGSEGPVDDGRAVPPRLPAAAPRDPRLDRSPPGVTS